MYSFFQYLEENAAIRGKWSIHSTEILLEDEGVLQCVRKYYVHNVYNELER